MDWINDPRLWVAATPLCVYIGAIIGFYLATESGDPDPVPEVHRGETIDEPWGIPQPVRHHTLPGSTWLVLPKDQALQRNDTAQFARVEDTGRKIHA